MIRIFWPAVLTWSLLSLSVGCANTGVAEGEGGADACEAFQDDAGAEVLIRFQNTGNEEIYLSTFCNLPDRPSFTVHRDGVELPIDPTECVGTCGDAQESGKAYCPVTDCQDLGLLLRIEPGASYEFAWQATMQVPASMPGGCYASTKPIENECLQQVALEEAPTVIGGSYITRAQMRESGAPSGTFGCSCALAADTDGVCEIDRITCQISSGDQTLPPVTANLPCAGVVELLIPSP